MGDNEKIDLEVLEKYTVVKKLGSGAYGHVWKVRAKCYAGDSRFYALKKIFYAFQHATDAQRTYRYISILSKLSHVNIIKLHEIVPSSSKRDVYLLFEYMSTDLYRGIYENLLEHIHKKYVIYQTLLGLYYLHSAKLMHRDLKPSNILINEKCYAKICDFGLVRYLGYQNHEESGVLTEGVATRWYRAPEVLLGSRRYDQKADMWSMGCIIAEVMIKNALFPGNSTIQQLEKIMQFTGKPNQLDLSEMDSEIGSTIISQYQQIKTKSHKEYFGNGFDPVCLDLIVNLLQFRASKRLSAEESLRHPFFKEFFKESDLVEYNGTIVLEINDDIKIDTEQYRTIIEQCFIDTGSVSYVKGECVARRRLSSPMKRHSLQKEPQRFSDLKKRYHRYQSFGKILYNCASKTNCSYKYGYKRGSKLFCELVKVSQYKQSRVNRPLRDKYNERDSFNTASRNIDKFDNKLSKQFTTTNTFSNLKKITHQNVRFAK